MPGISLLYDIAGKDLPDDSIIIRALNQAIHSGSYKKEILLAGDRFFLGCTKYEGYPLKVFQESGIQIVIEGRIYNKGHYSIEHELATIAQELFCFQGSSVRKIEQWLLDTDGEFVVVFVHKPTGRVGILNDLLGRLPVYYCNTNEKFYLSRELRFIMSFVDNQTLDEMAIAQYLLFEYTLGRRTLLNNIYRLPPAMLVQMDPRETAPKMQKLHSFNFEEEQNENRTTKKNAQELAYLFGEACRSRASSDCYNILSLSGGLDSRSVAAGLHKYSIPFVGATFLDTNGDLASDIPVAKQVAKSFDIEWAYFKLSDPSGDDRRKLLRMKSGLNSLNMSFILGFFEKLRQSYGDQLIYFTGDGGDKLLPNLDPLRPIRSLDQLLDYIIKRHGIISLEVVSEITGVAKDIFFDDMKTLLSSYPELDWNQKYVHFMLHERGMKWLFEGEDRNRCYFWSTAPFFGISVFRYAMNCPNHQKKYHRLYREFLTSLSPTAASIPDSNCGLAPTSFLYVLRQMALSFLYKHPIFLQQIKRKRNTFRLENRHKIPTTLYSLREQLANCKTVQTYFSFSALQAILKNPVSLSSLLINRLFTLTSLIESLETEAIDDDSI